MNKRLDQWSVLLNNIHHADQILFHYLRQRTTLIAAVVGIALFVTGIVRHNMEMSVDVVLAGAMGYLVGFIPAVIGGILLTSVRFYMDGFSWSSVPIELLLFISCVYIAWLGREHRIASIKRKSEVHGFKQTSQVVTWSMINEVRNSLLAMRLLLFSKQKESADTNLQLVEEELMRLDSLFHSLDEKNNYSHK